MPKACIEIPEVYNAILRPAVLQLSSDILDQFGLKESTNIIFRGNAVKPASVGGTMDDIGDAVQFSTSQRMEVEAEIIYPDDSYHLGQPFRNDYLPIIKDDFFDIDLSPLYAEREITLKCKLYFQNRIIMDRWYSEHRRRIAMGLEQRIHSIEYHYPIPPSLIEVTHYLFGLMPQDKTYGEWLKANMKSHLTFVSDRGGDSKLLAVKQRQHGIIGEWVGQGLAEPQKEDNGDQYSIDFSYRVRLEQPASVSIRYPMIVNNNLVSDAYREACDYNAPLILGSPGKTRFGYDHVQKGAEIGYPATPVTIPCFDDWLPDRVPMATSTIMTGLIGVDTNDPTAVMSLADLNTSIVFSDWMQELMRLFQDSISEPQTSPVLVQLYRGDTWINAERLVMDDQLYLRTTGPMNPMLRYHVRVALYNDLTLVAESALEKLRRHGELCQSLFATLGPDLLDEIPETLSDGSIRRDRFWEFIRKLPLTNDMYKNGIEVATIDRSLLYDPY